MSKKRKKNEIEKCYYCDALVSENNLEMDHFPIPQSCGGTVMVPSSEGTLGQILRSSGTPNQPVWISPNSAGFTAFTSTNVITTADAADTLAYIAFVNAGTDSNQGIRYNQT